MSPVPRPPPASHVAVCVRASVAALMRRLRQGSTPAPLTPAKWSVLAQLHRLGPLAPSDLARLERVRLQTLTRLLAQIEAASLVERRGDPSDGRRRVLALTPAGRAMLTAEVHRREASLRVAVQRCLTPAERAVLVEACALLDRIGDALA